MASIPGFYRRGVECPCRDSNRKVVPVPTSGPFRSGRSLSFGDTHPHRGHTRVPQDCFQNASNRGHTPRTDSLLAKAYPHRGRIRIEDTPERRSARNLGGHTPSTSRSSPRGHTPHFNLCLHTVPASESAGPHPRALRLPSKRPVCVPAGIRHDGVCPRAALMVCVPIEIVLSELHHVSPRRDAAKSVDHGEQRGVSPRWSLASEGIADSDGRESASQSMPAYHRQVGITERRESAIDVLGSGTSSPLTYRCHASISPP